MWLILRQKKKMPSTLVFKKKWMEEPEHQFNSIEPECEEEDDDDEIYHIDPLIVIEWNEAGLTQRGVLKTTVINNSIFCVNGGHQSHQIFIHVIRRLQSAYLQPNTPSLGRVFWVTFPRANVSQVNEVYNVFTI
ncbi:hypothetical protein GLOIN_2v1593194 [Rhizophagus clarus]|uniref:Uncharacterized protein n=1 Tax=Rhizophagus clarus TaxID=94130 RepID=A0A8H3MF40_9GLOM|nr:hypothetical protein GLOIN_2v1593194 [Rhizophagus clarus]